MVKIKEIPANDRPIERLLNYGSNYLSNEELIAIIIKTGTYKYSSKEISSILLSEIDGLKNIININYEQLIKIKGIGKVKAVTILALIEITRRINMKVETIYNVKITNTSKVFEYYKDKFKEKSQEYFYAIYLDNNKRIIKEKLLYMGTINQTLIHPMDIFKEAYLSSAISIVCIHNHPSGNVLPSKNDIEITNNLRNIGKLMGIEIIDHIIIGQNNYYSFYENGLIK